MSQGILLATVYSRQSLLAADLGLRTERPFLVNYVSTLVSNRCEIVSQLELSELRFWSITTIVRIIFNECYLYLNEELP